MTDEKKAYDIIFTGKENKVSQMNWIDRQWNFEDAAMNYDRNVSTLNDTVKIFLEMIADIPAEKLKLKPSGKWSINEHARHLLTMESLWIARLDDFVMGSKTLRPWNGTNADTDAGGFNQQRIRKVLEDFRDVRSAHTQMLLDFSNKSKSYQCYHERLEHSMTLADHVHFIVAHDLHHLQIVRNLSGKP